MKSCPYFTGVLVAYDPEQNRQLITTNRCKRWSCDYCAERNRQIWRANIIDSVTKLQTASAEAGGRDYMNWTFWTLTSHQRMRGFDASYRCIRSGWKKLYDRTKRAYGKGAKLEYLRVWEQHQDGTLHQHMIISATIVHRWAKDNCASCGLGYQTDVQHVTGHVGTLAAYVTKYITKDLRDYPSGFRRIQGSSAFSLRKTAENGLDWQFMDIYTVRDAAEAWSKNRDVYDLVNDKLVTTDDFIYHDIYNPNTVEIEHDL